MATADEESVQERQENELQLLQAVYLDDVVDLRQSDAWKVIILMLVIHYFNFMAMYWIQGHSFWLCGLRPERKQVCCLGIRTMNGIGSLYAQLNSPPGKLAPTSMPQSWQKQFFLSRKHGYFNF